MIYFRPCSIHKLTERGGTTLREGPGPPLDRWTGTDVTTLLLTVAVPQRTREKKEERDGES